MFLKWCKSVFKHSALLNHNFSQSFPERWLYIRKYFRARQYISFPLQRQEASWWESVPKTAASPLCCKNKNFIFFLRIGLTKSATICQNQWINSLKSQFRWLSGCTLNICPCVSHSFFSQACKKTSQFRARKFTRFLNFPKFPVILMI